MLIVDAEQDGARMSLTVQEVGKKAVIKRVPVAAVYTRDLQEGEESEDPEAVQG